VFYIGQSLQDCLVITKWSWHSLRQNVIPHKFRIKWVIFTANIELCHLLWQQHILQHKTTYFLHALLMDEESALCQNISINPDSMFLYFAALLSSGLSSSLMDYGVLYFKLTWRCQVPHQIFSVRNILSSITLFKTSSFSWNDSGLCFMPVV